MFQFYFLFMVWKELDVIFFSCFRRERQNTVLLNCFYGFSILSDFCCCYILLRKSNPAGFSSFTGQFEGCYLFPVILGRNDKCSFGSQTGKGGGFVRPAREQVQDTVTDCSIIELIVSTMVVFSRQ